MTLLPEFDINYKYFLDQSTLLFGEAKTGKSSIMVDILYHLKPHVEQIIVFSPTDPQNHTYDRGIVPLPCIHYTITAELLENIWERQNALAAVYTRANEPATLKKLFDRLQTCTGARAYIKEIYSKLETFKAEVEQAETEASVAKAKIASMELECNKLITMIWKHYIGMNVRYLEQLGISDDERYSLKYLDLNPRIVLIFDDCTPELKKLNNNPVIKKMFYQGRWAYITFLIACHTDKCIDPELKKNAFVSVFTEETCANAYFDRPSNNFGKDMKERARAALKAAFTSLAHYQKLIWIREDRQFYRFTATLRSQFTFGGDMVREYCARCQVTNGTRILNNKFMHEFN